MQIFFIESVEEFLKSNSIPFQRNLNTITFASPHLPKLILVPLNEATADAALQSGSNSNNTSNDILSDVINCKNKFSSEFALDNNNLNNSYCNQNLSNDEEYDDRKVNDNLESDDSSAGSVIYLYEDRWRCSPQITGKRLLAHLGHFQRIHARLCKVVTLENCKRFSITPTQFKEKVRSFLNKYHPYGYLKCDFPYALLFKESIVAAGSFSTTRKEAFEWTRHATLPDVRIPGGMGKALEAFVQNRKKEGTLCFEVMSYSDNEWSNGEVYKTLGFKEEAGLPPITYHINPATFQRLNSRQWQQLQEANTQASSKKSKSTASAKDKQTKSEAIIKHKGSSSIEGKIRNDDNEFITIKNKGSRKWKKYFNFTL